MNKLTKIVGELTFENVEYLVFYKKFKYYKISTDIINISHFNYEDNEYLCIILNTENDFDGLLHIINTEKISINNIIEYKSNLVQFFYLGNELKSIYKVETIDDN